MNALYNEIEPYAADWLDNLIERGLVAAGRVERRSIADLTPADVAGPGQRHFFAGIGGWSYALRLAGVPDDADVWTGSCPCQPFSDAGKRGGTRDPRHLWPAWFELIRECRPPAIFGEQVASRAGLAWFDAVRADLERCGYAVGASDLCAASVGAPHIRQRLYFVAFAGGEGREGERLHVRERGSRSRMPEVGGAARLAVQLGNSGSSRSGRDSRGLPDAQAQGEGERCEPRRVADESVYAGATCPCEGDLCTNPDCDWPDEHNGRTRTTGRIPGERDMCDCGHRAAAHDGLTGDCEHCSCTYFVGDPALDRIARATRRGEMARAQAQGETRFDGGDRAEHAGAAGRTVGDADQPGRQRRAASERRQARDDAPRAGSRVERVDWRNAVWLPCLDGKARPVEPGLEPLAHGVSGRVAVRGPEGQAHEYNRAGALAGFGNAIVPELGAAFIQAAIAARRSVK